MPGSKPFPGLAAKARLYLNPLGVSLGLKVNAALPLAGGPFSFLSVQAIIAAGGRRIYDAAFPISSLAKLRARLPADFHARFDALLSNLTAKRPSFGKLSFSRPLVMGILNVTPDSFSDGGDSFAAKDAVRRARQIAKEGADILDVGAESTRPGSKTVPAAVELRRLAPVLTEIRKLKIPVSVDTRKSAVMQKALAAGAAIINDVSALRYDKKSLVTLQNSRAGIVLMHMHGTPAIMQKNPRYGDVLLEVFDFLEERIALCRQAGIARNRLFADPGFGFGKTTAHNAVLLNHLAFFHGLGVPLLAGLSRKRF
ncbi:MAG TPA: dihydropteroate synthase, partial [Sphingomonadales bacterium]|nr:dihydropteroate synthase [Sphingomonadales bacterium]